ncbi:hypothetical protein [Neomegalonema perideroedes]|uniref:hypothetical protein n=1 Tax=Neomegalonema perideroedes TaxID=217219 RepID=UPI0003761078|nr:hypothetical protein [Neomegalonema perideroedes]
MSEAKARPLGRRLADVFGAAAAFGAPYALFSDLFDDGAVNRGWGWNLIMGAAFGLTMVAVKSFIARRFPAKTKMGAPPSRNPRD